MTTIELVPQDIVRNLICLLTAALLGGFIGWERRSAGKAAGLRTHMLVALGSALFLQCLDPSQRSADALSRVIQGVAAGIGFIGAGTILKYTDEGTIHGLTTAASVWLTASVGLLAGTGRVGTAVLATVLALFVLFGLGTVEQFLDSRQGKTTSRDDGDQSASSAGTRDDR